MKRIRPSGASNRKTKKLREQESNRCKGSLLKYLESSDSKDNCASNQRLRTHDADADFEGQALPQPEVEDTVDGALSATISVHVSEGIPIQVETNLESTSSEVVAIEEVDYDQLLTVGTSNHLESIPSVTSEEEPQPSLFESCREESEDPRCSTLTDFSDIGQWPAVIPDSLRVSLVEIGPEAVQHRDSEFAAVSRSGGATKGGVRHLTRDWFFKNLINGEKILRVWMMYSPEIELSSASAASYSRIRGEPKHGSILRRVSINGGNWTLS